MRFPEVKERKTAHDLADMIRRDLSGVVGCPTNGVNVTVYGLNPWNALLMFDASAGAVPNSKEVRRLFDVITDRLKRLYYIER
jgi:hypothetical protein